MLYIAGPKDLPRVARMAGQATGKAAAYVTAARTKFARFAKETELDKVRSSELKQVSLLMVYLVVANQGHSLQTLFQCNRGLDWNVLSSFEYQSVARHVLYQFSPVAAVTRRDAAKHATTSGHSVRAQRQHELHQPWVCLHQPETS